MRCTTTTAGCSPATSSRLVTPSQEGLARLLAQLLQPGDRVAVRRLVGWSQHRARSLRSTRSLITCSQRQASSCTYSHSRPIDVDQQPLGQPVLAHHPGGLGAPVGAELEVAVAADVQQAVALHPGHGLATRSDRCGPAARRSGRAAGRCPPPRARRSCAGTSRWCRSGRSRRPSLPRGPHALERTRWRPFSACSARHGRVPAQPRSRCPTPCCGCAATCAWTTTRRCAAAAGADGGRVLPLFVARPRAAGRRPGRRGGPGSPRSLRSPGRRSSTARSSSGTGDPAAGAARGWPARSGAASVHVSADVRAVRPARATSGSARRWAATDVPLVAHRHAVRRRARAR